MTTEAQRTDELPEDKREIELSGTPTRGNGTESFSCPLKKEDARGVGISRRLWLIQSTLLHTVLSHTLILRKPVVTLCACHVHGLNTKVKYCVLNAEDKVIMCLPIAPEPYAGAVNPKLNESNLSLTKSIGREKRTNTGNRSTGDSTQRKKL